MLAVLLPTRNKPEELARIAVEIERTRRVPDTRLYAYIANDDPQFDKYLDVCTEHAKDGLVYSMFGDPVGFSRGINKLAEIAIRDGATILMRCEDDFYFVDRAWDLAYQEAMPKDGIGMVWCNYILKGPDAEPHTGAIGANWYRTLGFFSLPELKHYWCDNVLLDLGKAVGRARYISYPFIDHRHNAHDPRKAESPNMANWDRDSAEYKAWKKKRMAGMVEKLNAAKQHD